MSIKRLYMLSWSLLFMAAPAAVAWTPSECGPEIMRGWAEHAQRIRNAPEDSPLYVPRPFPKQDADVLEDLRYGYLRMWGDNDFSDDPPEARLVYDGLRNGDLKFVVERVENWSLGRCVPTRQERFDYLVRIFLADGATEVARATVEEDGLVGSWEYRPEDQETRELWASILRSPADTRSALAKELGIRASDGQLVQTSGTQRCQALEPCVAFRGAGRILLVDKRGDVYEIRDRAKRFSRAEALDRDSRAAMSKGRVTGDERVISIGSEMAVAERIGRVQPPTPAD
jgi:hypothetical protein